MRIRLFFGLALLAAALGLAACGGPSTPAEPAYDPAVTPLTGADLENVSSIKNADGDTPCGVFNVNGFGFKTADLKAFPNCAASTYTVMCLNDKAAWIDDNISEVKTNAGVVSFTSAQEGTCGLFTKP